MLEKFGVLWAQCLSKESADPRGHRVLQTQDRDIGSAARIWRGTRSDPHTSSIRWNFVGQIDLMRTTFGGLGIAIGLSIMVVFMIAGLAVSVAALAACDAVYDSGVAFGNRAGAALCQAWIFGQRRR